MIPPLHYKIIIVVIIIIIIIILIIIIIIILSSLYPLTFKTWSNLVNPLCFFLCQHVCPLNIIARCMVQKCNYSLQNTVTVETYKTQRNYLLIIDIFVFGGRESRKSSPDSSNEIRDGLLAFKVRNYFFPSLVKLF